MKMNFVVGLKDLSGKEITDNRNENVTLSKILGNAIITEEAKDQPVLKYELATKLFNAKGEVDITETEKEIIKTVCTTGKLNILSAAQILIIVNNAK